VFLKKLRKATIQNTLKSWFFKKHFETLVQTDAGGQHGLAGCKVFFYQSNSF
jgi:hypothetical protein